MTGLFINYVCFKFKDSRFYTFRAFAVDVFKKYYLEKNDFKIWFFGRNNTEKIKYLKKDYIFFSHFKDTLFLHT